MSILDQRIPVLDLCTDHASGSDRNGDWPDGDFEAECKSDKTDSAGEVFLCEVEMRLSGAYGIQEMLTASPPRAFFCLEVRCSQTGWSKAEILDTRKPDAVVADEEDHTTMGVMIFRVEKRMVTETFHLWPSVVSLGDTQMSYKGMHPMLQEVLTKERYPMGVNVPANYQLAIGRPLEMRPDRGHAPFFFNKTDEMKEGEMSLQFSTEGGDGVFEVRHNITEERVASDKSLWWGVYASVLGLLPQTEGAKVEYTSRGTPEVVGSPTLTALAVRLHNADLPLWSGTDWDPLQVLTAVKNMEGHERQPLFPLPADYVGAADGE